MPSPDQDVSRSPDIPTGVKPMGETAAEPACECIANGQPMTDVGVMHSVDCEWGKWFMATGGTAVGNDGG